MLRAGRDAHPGVLQLQPDAAALEPVGLVRVDPAHPRVQLGEHGQVRLDAGHQRVARADHALGRRQVLEELGHDLLEVADGVTVLEDEDVTGHVRRDVGVAVAVAADPAAEAQRPRGRRQVDTQAGQLVGQVLEHVADGVQHQLVEVVGGVARLVERLGPVEAELGGLPQQVDDLGDPPVGPRVVGGVEQLGDPPPLRQDRPAGRLGRVRREDRPHRETGHQVGHLVGGQSGRADPFGGLRQPAALEPPLVAHGPGPVDLLRHVGQVEVGPERPHQQRGGRGVDALQECGEVATARPLLRTGRYVATAEVAHLLDERQELGTLLAHQALAEQVAEAAHVGAQRCLPALARRCLLVGTDHGSTIGRQVTARDGSPAIRDRRPACVRWTQHQAPPPALRSGVACVARRQPGRARPRQHQETP